MTKTWKIVLLAVLGLAATCGATVGIVFSLTSSLTSGLVDAAEGFFLAVKADDMDRARGFLSEEFRASTDEQALRAYLAKSALVRFEEASWSSRSLRNGRGELEGAVETEGGGSIPIKLSFVKENGAWKIYALRKPAAGLVGSSEDGEDQEEVPSAAVQVAMLQATVHELGLARNAGDFTQFRAKSARVWQDQITPEQLREALGGPVIEGDLTSLDPVAPILDGATTLKDGVLAVQAHYVLGEDRLYVRAKYVYEGVAWKLIGVHFGPKPLE